MSKAKQHERADNVAPTVLSHDEVFKGLSTNTGECMESNGGVCSSKKVVMVIADFIRDVAPAAKNPVEVVKIAAKKTGCDSELCVLTSNLFQNFVVTKGAENDVKRDVEVRFKPKGPRDNTDLLSNYDIDGVMRKWAYKFETFYPCPFAMMDFETNGDQFGEFCFKSMLEGKLGFGGTRKKFDCFGCVVNTDVSSGRGKHWVAVFVDCRKPSVWHVEYFNSVGNPPPKPMIKWMERTKSDLYKHGGGSAEVLSIPVTDVDHQESQTECGLYSLYYIRRRIENTPHTFFQTKIVPDDAMTEFRKHIFR
jgi:hypothetical protein